MAVDVARGKPNVDYYVYSACRQTSKQYGHNQIGESNSRTITVESLRIGLIARSRDIHPWRHLPISTLHMFHLSLHRDDS